jgi:hypothetical protein
MEETVDYRFENHGSIWLCTPLTDAAREHLEQHTDDEAQFWGGCRSLVVEPRYVESLQQALEANDWTWEYA